jgi:hypothetical protein
MNGVVVALAFTCLISPVIPIGSANQVLGPVFGLNLEARANMSSRSSLTWDSP